MNDTSAAQLFWWVGLPYLGPGHLRRRARLAMAIRPVRLDQPLHTTSGTSRPQVGSPLFHYGTFAAIAGHVIGILITASVPETVGISEPTYRWFSAVAGSVAAVLAIGGIVVLAGRRLLIPRVRAMTSAVDYVALILLLVVVLTGIAPTIGVNLFGGGYDYRQTVAPWFRGLFTGQPDVHAIAAAPIIYQVHATAAG